MLIFIVLILSQPQLRPNWPAVIVCEDGYGNWGGPKAFDIDADGEKEILFAGGSQELGGILYAFNLDGSSPIGWPITISNPPLFFEQSPVIGDIDGDNVPEILIGTFGFYNQTGSIYAFEFNGSLVSGFPINAPTQLDIMYPLTLGDINTDGLPEIIVVFTHYSGSNMSDLMGIIDPLTGEFFEGWPIIPRSQDWFQSRAVYWPDIGIVNFFGNGNEFDSVAVWSIGGDILPGWPHGIPGFPGMTMPSIAVLTDQDGYNLIVPWHGPYPPDITAYMYVFKSNGSTLPNFPISFSQNFFQTPPAVADVDNDDELEIIQDGGGRLNIINTDGTYTTLYTGVSQYEGEPAIADVDGDSTLEIIIGRSDLGINDSSVVLAVNIYGVQPEGWPIQVIGTPEGTPLIDDLDGDGYLEMVVFTKGTPWLHPDTGWLYLFDLPAPFDSAMVPWGQYAHDLWNSGIYGFNPPVSVDERPPLQIPSSYQVVYRNGIPELIFTLNHPQTIQFHLYDVTGRMLWWNVSRYPSGTHRLRLPGTIPSGLHILKLRGDQTQALKVIKLR